MASPSDRLATSVSALNALRTDGRRVFRSKELSRIHRERLRRNGCLDEIMKGWLVAADPVPQPGESRRERDPLWEFCACYCASRFGEEWHLSPEQSLLLHVGSQAPQKKIVIHSPKGANNDVALRSGASIYDLKQKVMPSRGSIVVEEGLRLLSVPAALTRVPESFFQRFPSEARSVLAGLPNSIETVRLLLEDGRSSVAGRLAGAFRSVGRSEIAEAIATAMKAEGFAVRESDPFVPAPPAAAVLDASGGLAAQLRELWDRRRKSVLQAFPPPPGMQSDSSRLLRLIDEQCDTDALHSLSISGFDVSPELVADANSRPDAAPSREVLAARGYRRAFEAVKEGVASVLEGEQPGNVARRKHGNWYWELIQPGLAAGLIDSSALAGYRDGDAEFRASKRMPRLRVPVGDAMNVLFDLLESEESPAAGALLGHFLFASIKPYPSCNGRVARFLFNFMLMSGGYPWTVFPADGKDAYLAALQKARDDLDFAPLAGFLVGLVKTSIEKANRTRATP